MARYHDRSDARIKPCPGCDRPSWDGKLCESCRREEAGL